MPRSPSENTRIAGLFEENITPRGLSNMIVVHHLENSRSQRILWLLEELQVPYEVSPYDQCSFVCSAAAVAMGVPLSMFPASLKIRDRGQWTCRNLISGAEMQEYLCKLACSAANLQTESTLRVSTLARAPSVSWHRAILTCAGFEEVV